MRRGLLWTGVAGAALAFAASSPAAPARELEVVVTLDAPPLARAIASSRTLTAAVKRRRLSLSSPASASYLRSLAASQRALAARIERAVPGARVRWRYGVVLNGLAVVVPIGATDRLAALPGVARVYPSVRYHALLERTPAQIGAPPLWGPDLSGAGAGMKIGIIDDGVDQTHPFLSPQGYAMPAGFPLGVTSFTSAKVIVARAFPPPSPGWRHAAKPFDPEHSDHGTHVAGIAAGNNAVVPAAGRSAISGVAPRAHLGNYKVLTIPTASDVGLDGNSPEIVAGIEAAVRDGMDVINLSLGEPEIEPSRDIVVRAIDAAADAGVIPTVAAGNDFRDFGFGTVGSPGSAAKAITAGATTSATAVSVAGFSSAGPTPVSLQLKPDVLAPGSDVLSSVPRRRGLYTEFSGTSMAAPHVAGAAALLRQRHPTWTPEQVKAALVLTGTPPRAAGEPTTRTGGGRVDLLAANDPLVFAAPSSLSFGLLRARASVRRSVEVSDAGGGGGIWSVSVTRQTTAPDVSIDVPASVTVPGRLEVAVSVSGAAARRMHTGFVVLTRGATQRRIPYWLDVAVPALRRHRATPLRRSGTYRGNTAGRPALVSDYLYPSASQDLAGPEQVFRVRLARRVANFGVAILSQAPGVRVQARIVVAGDENRQVGYTSLPINHNPYLPDFLRPRPASGALRPASGSYDIVFDTPARAAAGRFAFRFWIDDTSPPRLRLLTRSARAGAAVGVAAADSGSGVDPQSVYAWVDGKSRAARFVRARGRVAVSTTGLAPGRHRLELQVSDYQESRNNENVPRILPNTRRLAVIFVVVDR